jgi:hypothetical protein
MWNYCKGKAKVNFKLIVINESVVNILDYVLCIGNYLVTDVRKVGTCFSFNHKMF